MAKKLNNPPQLDALIGTDSRVVQIVAENERLRAELAARVPLRGWVTPDLTPDQAHNIAAHAPRLDVERHLVWCYKQIASLRAALSLAAEGEQDDTTR